MFQTHHALSEKIYIPNVPAVSAHYSALVQTVWLMHEDYLYGDISLHFSYHAQCLANLEQILKSISDLSRSGLTDRTPSPHLSASFSLAESNYKMPQLPILSQQWVIKKRGLFCPRLHQVTGELQRD